MRRVRPFSIAPPCRQAAALRLRREFISEPFAFSLSRTRQVIWVNPRKILISHMDRRTIDDHRISVERPYIKEWNLLIRQVRYNDSGTYECRINTKPKQIKKVTLSVQGGCRDHAE